MEWWDIVSMFFQRHIVFRWIVIDMNGMPELDCIDLYNWTLYNPMSNSINNHLWDILWCRNQPIDIYINININININAYIITGYITNTSSNQDYDNQLERGYHGTSETYNLLYNML